MKKTLVYVVTLALLTASCSKSDSIKNTPVEKPENVTAAYLKFSDANEFFAEINKVSKMDDQQYANWKEEKQLSKTLFDRYLEVEERISPIADETQRKNSLSIDSNYFYSDGERLFSKNGVILDKLLNENGVVKVGNFIIRYQNRQLYYVSNADIKNEKLINEPNLSEKFLRTIVEESKVKTTKRAADHNISPVWGQNNTYNYTLKTQRFDYSKRRHFVDLKEHYTLVPFSGTPDYPNLAGWNISYNLYFEFGQHKKVLFTWNKYASSTRCSTLTAYPLSGSGTATLPYIPGYWLSNYYSYPTFTSLTGSFTTSATDHPTYNIYGAIQNRYGTSLSTLTSITNARLHARLSADDIPEHDFYFDPTID